MSFTEQGHGYGLLALFYTLVPWQFNLELSDWFFEQSVLQTAIASSCLVLMYTKHKDTYVADLDAFGAMDPVPSKFGIVWLVTLLFQLKKHGLIPANKRRVFCLSMFWHFLDVVWVGVFTFVYLMGVLP